MTDGLATAGITKREPDITVQGESAEKTEAEITNDAIVAATLARAALKKRTAEIYDRGVTGDRLFVDLPPEWDGQWVPKDQQSIYRMEALGYKLDDKFAPKRRLHDSGDSFSYVGDVVHMIAPREVREVIDEIKRERYEKVHGGKKQKEEKDFEAQQQSVASAGISTIAESNVSRVKRDEIAAAIQNPGS